MATEYPILRLHLLQYIKDYSRNPHASFNHDSLRRYLHSRGVDPDQDDLDWRTVKQIIHEFYFEGLIIPGTKITSGTTYSSGFLDWPSFEITAYGENVFQNTEYQPHDSDGYLNRLRQELPTIDSVIIRYLDECLQCYRRNLLLSAAVMLGCAAEKAVLLLIDQFGKWIADPQDKANFVKETNTFIIKRKYDALWKRLEPQAPSLPDNLGDQLGNILDRIFDIIRTTRNDVGHPSGRTIEKAIVHANLLLFPTFCKRIYGLLSYYQRPNT
jgi:hypothetical protein